MLPENIIYIGVLINLTGLFFYLRGMFKGQTKPNLVSFFIWMLAPFIGVFLQIRAGAGLSILPVFMAGFGPFVILSFSLWKKNAYWKINNFDIICGIFSLMALVLYILTHNLSISILFAILSDGLAAIPTIMKSWKFPSTETSILYTTGIINSVIGLLIIKNWIFPIYSFSVYIILINTIIIFAIYRKKVFKTYF